MNLERIIKFRHTLHSIAEISGSEKNTSALVKDYILRYIKHVNIHHVANTGILVAPKVLDSKKNILLRCELDALPIQEANNFPHRSLNSGVSHKCGHDGHMAIMLAVLEAIDSSELIEKNVFVLFQPSEENGEGAKAVLNDSEFHKICQPDFVIALHNTPGDETGEISCKPGTFTPSVCSVKFHFSGISSHAAEPQKGNNPINAIPELLALINKLISPEENQDHRVVTPVNVEMGSSDYGISAHQGSIGFTLRAATSQGLKSLTAELEKGVQTISETRNLRVKSEYFQEFSSIENDAYCFEQICKTAQELGFNYKEMKHPQPWGEDFGLFTERFRGAMFAVGAGKNHPPLHNPEYDFPDIIIEPVVNFLIRLLNNI